MTAVTGRQINFVMSSYAATTPTPPNDGYDRIREDAHSPSSWPWQTADLTSLVLRTSKPDPGPHIFTFALQKRPRATRASVPKVRTGCLTCEYRPSPNFDRHAC